MTPSQRTPLKQASHTKASRGQILVIFAGTLTVLLLMAALVVDLAWLWSNSLKIQRAADAAALAGVIHLPGDAPTAYLEANDGAARNGYLTGAGGVTVTPLQDVSAPRRLDVKVTAPVKTFFLTLIGMDTVVISRKAKAEYILPVPMGSPENYYGVFGPLRTAVTSGVTSWNPPSATASPSNWTNPTNAFTNNGVYATKATTTNPYQTYSNFGLTNPGGATITGLEVEMEARSTDSSGCRLGIELSRNGGSSWTSTGEYMALTSSDATDTLPSSGASTDLWGTTWTWTQLNNTNFRARVQYIDPGSGCTDASTTRLDLIRVRVHYTVGGGVAPNLNDPYGAALTPRGFWGTFINQGADKVNGDAYLPKWDPRKSSQNADYDPVTYYNYALEMPTGATSGELWIFDAPFCATDTSGQYGTGDRWFSGSTAATSAFYTLYDTNNTQYDLTDDVIVGQSGNLFANQQAADATLYDSGVPSVASCALGATSNQADGRYWHNRWWQMPTSVALVGDKLYRLHTRSTDPSNANAMNDANGHNSFALWSRQTGGATAPRIYGLGAMQAFTPLNGGGAAEFYLAQIEAVHAGKTVEIRLWDPGDTGALSASLQILIPSTTGYTATSFNWSSEFVASSGTSACDGRTGSGTSVVTNTGGAMQFNGCWLTIQIAIPPSYTAPQPPGEPGPGWWKIRYVMGGSTSEAAFDLTTWQVDIRGNPVHLVEP